MKRKVKSRTTSKKPVLVLGWGAHGCTDVDWIAKALGYDEALDCVKAPCVDSRRVLKEVEKWLSGHSNAQALCIGAHGVQNGLVPNQGSKDKVGYGELAETIAINRHSEAPPLTLFLGVCESDHAAELWRTLEHANVRLLVAFAGEPDSGFVQEVLTTFIQQGDILQSGKVRIDKALTYLDEDVEDLMKRFPGVSIHYNLDQLINVSELQESGEGSLREHLERVGRVGPGSLLYEAALVASTPATTDDGSIPHDEDDVRSMLKIRTIGPRPRRK